MYKLCGEKPASTLKMSLGEIALCLDCGYENFKTDVQLHVDLKCAILNASWTHRKDKRLWTWGDFLSKEMLPPKPKKREITESEKSKRWAAAGAAMMKVVREHEAETGVKV